MAYARKSKGYRRITVDGVTCRWRFDTEGPETAVTLQAGASSGQQAAIVFADVPGWWQRSPSAEHRPPSVSPRHVARLVRIALQRGWTPTLPRSSLRLMLSWAAEFSDEAKAQSDAERRPRI